MEWTLLLLCFYWSLPTYDHFRFVDMFLLNVRLFASLIGSPLWVCPIKGFGETGKSMREWIKEHDRDIRLARPQTSAVSQHDNKFGPHPLWDEVKFIY